jgi:hypothetical protein
LNFHTQSGDGTSFYAERHTDFFYPVRYLYPARQTAIPGNLQDLGDEGHKAGRCIGWQGTQQSLGQKEKL